ncbi:MAG: translesion error-prone DNA polymerase V autoproteolytic subunit [Bacteroidaceae bacterium]|nr:translesion error-prone DNA polymerase V autoproteolytic subunit [Bacteroidaceae bacterium]
MSRIEDIKPITPVAPFAVASLGEAVPAGFPSPAQDHIDDGIDLNRELIHHPASTFCARVAGDSMRDCGIDDGDLLIIDKSIEPREGSIAVCFVDGEFTLKRISIRRDGIWLEPANPQYPALHVVEGSNFQVWGIVSYVVKAM